MYVSRSRTTSLTMGLKSWSVDEESSLQPVEVKKGVADVRERPGFALPQAISDVIRPLVAGEAGVLRVIPETPHRFRNRFADRVATVDARRLARTSLSVTHVDERVDKRVGTDDYGLALPMPCQCGGIRRRLDFLRGRPERPQTFGLSPFDTSRGCDVESMWTCLGITSPVSGAIFATMTSIGSVRSFAPTSRRSSSIAARRRGRDAIVSH